MRERHLRVGALGEVGGGFEAAAEAQAADAPETRLLDGVGVRRVLFARGNCSIASEARRGAWRGWRARGPESFGRPLGRGRDEPRELLFPGREPLLPFLPQDEAPGEVHFSIEEPSFDEMGSTPPASRIA